MKKLSIFFLFFSTLSSAQTAVDTITFMHYNVLNYRNVTSYCSNSNNNASSKDGYMKTIVGYALPDILTCNEIAGDGGTAANRLLTNALNKDGRSYYKQCSYQANSNLCNMLYYNKNKFALYNQDKIERAANNSFLVRLIDVYTLYYTKSSSLANGDTTFLTVYVTHLKAGSSSSDKVERAEMTEAVMKYHEDNYNNINYIIAGDFNIQTHSEACYQTLTKHSNTAIRFYDPKDKPGSWNNNSNYADLHTQSTRSSSSNGGCFSTGGLDDRFDIVLCGKEVMDNTNGVKYISGSYKAMGNDALHFNKDIITPANLSAPGNVISALYNMSDHLPVVMRLGITRGTASVNPITNLNKLIVGNPISSTLHWKLESARSGVFNVTDIQGKQILNQQVIANANWHLLGVSSWKPGTYFVSFTDTKGVVVRTKVLKL